MEYKELATLYHMDASSSRDSALQKEYAARFNAESAFRIGFCTSNGELFFTIPRELAVLSERVLVTERTIARLLGTLPRMAQQAVLRGMVLDEVVSTNSIENIHSTRRQIKNALDATRSGDESSKRFRELALLYLGIIDDACAFPNSPAGIRAIYDHITAGEIPSEKAPDGQLFRKEGVSVIAGDGCVVHRGLEPEAVITTALEQMLALVGDQTVPALYAALASHYLFEYAHPFYDGNGRTGRFLVSLLLSKVLSVPTALSFSRTIAQHRARYYRAFKTVEDKLNHAELTFFVYDLLTLIHAAQSDIIERLEASLTTLDSLEVAMRDIVVDEALKDKEARIVSLLFQYGTFGLFGDASVAEIADFLGVGAQQARKYVAGLEKRGICQKRNSYDPVTFMLSEDFRKRCGIDLFFEDEIRTLRSGIVMFDD